MERNEQVCTCEDCGKRFRRGEEGDNERFCLRCEHSSRLEAMDQDEYDQYLVFGDVENE